MDKQQYLSLLPYKELMKQIIINSAASNISLDYKLTLEKVGNELGHKLSCTCSSGWFKLTNNVYKEFLLAEAEFSNDKKQENENENSGKKSNSKNKRK